MLAPCSYASESQCICEKRKERRGCKLKSFSPIKRGKTRQPFKTEDKKVNFTGFIKSAENTKVNLHVRKVNVDDNKHKHVRRKRDVDGWRT